MDGLVRVSDRGVAIAFTAVSCLALASVYRSAADRSELTHLREQNQVLSLQLKKLDSSLTRIRQYTKTASSLATTEVKPSDVRQLPDLTFIASNYPFGALLGRIGLAAKAGTWADGASGTDDLLAFSRTLAQIDGLNRDTDVVVRRLSGLATILKYNKDLMRGIPSVMPVDGRIASEFGVRLSPFGGKRALHAGIDIAAVEGTDVHSPADGTVTFVGPFDTLGLTVVVSHGNTRVLTRYGHLSRARVHVGDAVRRGDVIASTGNSGNSTGPHLHYEVWMKNTPVNPRDFFFDLSDASGLAAQGGKPANDRNLASAEVDAEL